MSSWDEFCDQRRGAIERFVSGDAGPYKQLWSHADDVTIFAGWGAYEQGWDAVSRRLDCAQPFRGGTRRHRQPRGLLER
jgi:hypothetical protein